MGWKDVTIEQFTALAAVLKKKYEDDEQKTFAILSVLHNKPVSYFLTIPLPDLKRLIREANFIQTKDIQKGVPSTLRIGLNKYNIQLNVNELSGGQYIDLTSYCKSQDSIDQNYHNIIATFLSPRDFFGRDMFKRKLKKAKTQEELEYVHSEIVEIRKAIAADLFNHLTMDKVFQLSNYFFLLYKGLMRGTRDYLVSRMKKQTKILGRQLGQTNI